MARSKQAFRVGISGSYGGLNLGDEAILAGIVTELRAVAAASRSRCSRATPRTPSARHEVERAMPVRKLSRDEVAAGGPAPRPADPRRRRHPVRRRGADLPARGDAGARAARAGDGLRDQRRPARATRRRRPRCATALEPRRGGHGARARRAARCWRTSACTARSWSPRTRRCCSSPSRCRTDVLKREGLDSRRGSWSACRCASPASAAPDIERAGLSRAARQRRRLHGRPLRRRRRVRADGAQDARHAARHAVIAQMLRAQRATRAEGRVHLGAAAVARWSISSSRSACACTS